MKNASRIIEKLRTGRASDKEKEMLDRWIHDLADSEPMKLNEDELIAINERGRSIMQEVIKDRTKRLWPRWVAAASVALAVMAGGYFYYNSNQTKDITELATVNDIAPGKEGATLTLADGRKILINDALSGKIAEQSGVRISKTADGEIIYEVVPDNSKILTYNTLTTTRGEQTRVRLPDGTLVFLNAESSLKYPTSFTGSARRAVLLSGEGYFEVSKDKTHPFEVATNKQRIEVLGTHFNVNAYSNNEAVRTTLLEGSVRVENLSSKKSQLLVPGQQAQVVGNAIDVASVEIDEVVSWKEGIFMYDGESLENIMKDVARWYNVEVEFADVSLKKKSIYITANRFDHLSELLKPLGRTAKVSFALKGNKITINKKDN